MKKMDLINQPQIIKQTDKKVENKNEVMKSMLDTKIYKKNQFFIQEEFKNKIERLRFKSRSRNKDQKNQEDQENI